MPSGTFLHSEVFFDSWINAEEACTRSLGQHRTGKGYWRRSKARQELGRRDEAIEGGLAFESGLCDRIGLTVIRVDLREMLKLRSDDHEATVELQRLFDQDSAERSANLSWSSSSSSSSPHWPPCVGGSSSSGPATTNAGKSIPQSKKVGDDLPFDLHSVDLTRMKIDTIKRTWISPDTGMDESFSYPVWDSHDVRFA